jgi:hypothetical protein
MSRFTFDTEIERGDFDVELRVTYSVTPFVAARLYGDYPQPAEGGEVELISVQHNGKPFKLADEEEEAILQECADRAASDMAEEAAAAADWKYQEYRDRQLMERWEREQ